MFYVKIFGEETQKLVNASFGLFLVKTRFKFFQTSFSVQGNFSLGFCFFFWYFHLTPQVF